MNRNYMRVPLLAVGYEGQRRLGMRLNEKNMITELVPGWPASAEGRLAVGDFIVQAPTVLDQPTPHVLESSTNPLVVKGLIYVM